MFVDDPDIVAILGFTIAVLFGFCLTNYALFSCPAY